MSWNLSKFGQKFTAEAGILRLMDDLGRAMASDQEVYMMGGGNPGHIPAMQAYFRRRMQTILANGDEFERLTGNYDAPQGQPAFREALADLLRQQYGWSIGPQNIALTNGSQTSFFYLFNLLAGPFSDGSHKKILLPLAPEYIGYVDTGLADDLFVANKPEISYLDEHTFKYHVNFDTLKIGPEIGAICVSRPTNPTGNVLTNDEIVRLSALAKENDIPFILDNAYGTPFPNIIFSQAEPLWADHIILCMSLSKLGLPGLRTGIVIANEAVISAISALNAIISLAPGGFGAGLALDMVRSGEIMQLSREVIQPYYQQRMTQAVDLLWEELHGTDFYIHKPEGSFFLWLWFKGLPISSYELYQRLKRRGAIVVPGHYFYPGLVEDWPHKHECIRMTYSQEAQTVRTGIQIIAAEVKQAYAAGG